MKRQRRETEEEEERERQRQRIERVERRSQSESQRDVGIKSSESNCLSSARQNDTNNTDTNLDIISTLPDSILAHILSRLSIREAVATSILSSRWITLWTLVPRLSLQEPVLNRPDLNLSFVDIASRIWTLRYAISNPMPLHTLHILWKTTPCRPFYVDTWVRAAIPRGLKVLFLNISKCNTGTESLVQLPRSVFFSSTLVTLKLMGNISLNPPSGSRFPCLRSLRIGAFKYENSESLSTILTACPVLLDFSLYVRLDENKGVFNLIIQVPTLKFLQLWCINSHFPSSSFKAYINTPALKFLAFKGQLIEDVVLVNLPDLVELVLQLGIAVGVNIEDRAKRIRDLLRSLAHVKALGLTTKTTEILCHASGYEALPMFRNLSHLRFLGCLYFEWRTIQFLLGRAPKLQNLVFKSCPDYSFGKPTPDGSWEEPLDVPECLSSHLTTCHYRGFLGDKDEMHLVRQILKTARVLKTLKIIVDSHLESEKKLHIRMALSKIVREFPKSSQTCEIAFDERTLL